VAIAQCQEGNPGPAIPVLAQKLRDNRVAVPPRPDAQSQDVRFADITIIEGIGASHYGIGMLSARVAEVILRDERAVFAAGSSLEPDMSDEEKQGLERRRRSAEEDSAKVHRLERAIPAAFSFVLFPIRTIRSIAWTRATKSPRSQTKV
jgi:hypothetical protein